MHAVVVCSSSSCPALLNNQPNVFYLISTSEDLSSRIWHVVFTSVPSDGRESMHIYVACMYVSNPSHPTSHSHNSTPHPHRTTHTHCELRLHYYYYAAMHDQTIENGRDWESF
jgi:hypothetical protein